MGRYSRAKEDAKKLKNEAYLTEVQNALNKKDPRGGGKGKAPEGG